MALNSPETAKFSVVRTFYTLNSLEGLKSSIGPGGDARFRQIKKGTGIKESSGWMRVPFQDGFDFDGGVTAFAFRHDVLVHDQTHRKMLLWQKQKDQGTIEETPEERSLRWIEEVDDDVDQNYFSPKTTVTIVALVPFGKAKGELSKIEQDAVNDRGYEGVCWIFSASDAVVKRIMQASPKLGLNLEYSAPWVVKKLEEPRAMVGKKVRGCRSYYGPMFFSELIRGGEFELDKDKINARLVIPTTFDVGRVNLARDTHKDFMRYLEKGAVPESVGLTVGVFSFNPQSFTMGLKSLQIAGITIAMPQRISEACFKLFELFRWLDKKFMDLYDEGVLSRYSSEDVEKIAPIFDKFGLGPNPDQEKEFNAALKKAKVSLPQYSVLAVMHSRKKVVNEKDDKKKAKKKKK